MKYDFSIVLTGAAAVVLSACGGPNDESATGDVPQTYTPKITQLGSGELIPFPGHNTYEHVSANDTPSQVAFLELQMEPRTFGAPPHNHDNEDEYFIVLNGAVTFLNGEDTVDAPTGTIAVLPRGHWHGFWNPNDEPATLLLAVAPGEFAGFFDEVVMNIRQENADNPERIGAIIAEISAKRRVTVDMSRLPPEAAALLGPPPE